MLGTPVGEATPPRHAVHRSDDSIFIVATLGVQLAVQYPEHIDMLTRMGVGVEIFAADFPPYLVTMPGVTCHAIPVKRLLDPLGAMASAVTIARHARRIRPQAIIYGSPSAAVVGALGGRLFIRHRLFVVHGLREETLMGARRAVMTTARRLSDRLSTQVIYVSQSLRRRAEQIDGRPSRHGRVAPGGFVGAALPNHLSSLRRTSDATTIGFVGRLARDKGVAELVGAIDRIRALHSPVRLLLVGDLDPTDPPDPETLRRIAADPDIEVAGHVGDVRPYLRRMDLFCLPSYREGLPTVVLEAMAEMVPVIGSDATGVSELVSDETGWPCETGSVTSLTDALMAAMDHPGEADRRALTARTLLEARYAVDPVMAWWQEVYDDIFIASDVVA